MGKPKDKSLKPAPSKHSSDVLSDTLSAFASVPSLRAADGHNVDGWADEDIRIYNELLSERAKLEKEKNELEQKSSRHQTQRALLDENSTTLDGLFKAQFGGDFKFTGGSSCCLDADLGNACAEPEGSKPGSLPCEHEICARAKTKGVSWMEMDTIKYYHARIMSERSPRMQNALRKQRDVELVRVKKDDEEELAWRARRAAAADKALGSSAEMPQVMPGEGASPVIPASLDMVASRQVLLDPKNSAILEAAKENEHVVRRIRGRLDRIRQDVNAGRVSPADARVSLDQANFEMAEAERKNNEFRQLIVDAEPPLSHNPQPNPATLSNILQNTLASSTTDTFSNALSVMRGFFSTSDPQEVQAAIGELRRVLEINGPMTPVLEKSFQALTDMVAKPKTKGLSAEDSATDRHGLVEVMMHLRQKVQASIDPSSALGSREMSLDEDTIKANFECIKVEEAAKKDMEKIAERMFDDTVENVVASLKKVKSKALLKSPIPPLSDIVLEDVITDILFQRSIKLLVIEAAGPVNLSSVSGKLTSLVINMAHKEPEKYMATLDIIKDCIQKTLAAQKKEPPVVLLDAVSKVEESIPKFVAAHEQKSRKYVTDNKPPAAGSVPATQAVSGSGKDVSFAKYLLTGDVVDKESWNAFRNFFRTPLVHDAAKVRDRVIEHYRKHRDEGIWEIFRVVADHHTLHTFRFESWAAEKELYCANMAVAAVSREKVLDAIVGYQKRGICPGMTAVVISQRLTYQVREDFDAAKASTMLLRNIFDHYKPPADSREWFQSFNFIAQAMIDLFAVMIFQVKGLDRKDAPILAADVIGTVCTFVLGAENAAHAAANLHVVQAFVSSTLVNNKDASEVGKLQGVLLRFLHMCEDSRYRCPPEHACKSQVKAFNAEKYKALIPAPLNVSKQPQPTTLKKQSLPTPTSTIEYLKQCLASQPAEKLRPLRIYMQCVHDWETATLLAPHLRCLHAGKSCTCTREQQEAAEEFQIRKDILDAGFEELKTYLKTDEDPPGALWVRLDKEAKALRELTLRKADEVEKESDPHTVQVKSRFAEHLGNGSKAEQRPDTQEIKLKQVAVNVPSVQNSLSSNSSESGNLERDVSEDSANHHPGKTISSATPASNSKPGPLNSTDNRSKTNNVSQRSTSAVKDKSPLAPGELAMLNQLVRFVEGVFRLGDTNSDLAAFTRKDALTGITNQLREMAIGHIEMAWIIAEAHGYSGLQSWIQHNFGRRGVYSTDNGDEEDLPASKDAATAAYGEKDPPKESLQRTQGGKVNQAADSALLSSLPNQPPQQAATDTDNTIQPQLIQKHTGSQRRKNLPKRKR
ncbi:hypothetical protein A1O1_00575 [Capronia coronata CBS 617.96]|uniref:Uncharacterized protein n=1 Tax=Capronia coronata CBS 617.96 TaxID=1182541 RepID=W9YSF2_9EURO|nr:uncharacterized protein A1O1_00575 [Capronia coronata CBS 617.96]EXJ95453.1 hypothetical protein A1O1_00575 [Capronia coronata CBS 617.96]